MIKLKKISPKNLTNDEVRAYDAKGKSITGKLEMGAALAGVLCVHGNFNDFLPNCLYYIKLSDIDKEARKQIKEMAKTGGK